MPMIIHGRSVGLDVVRGIAVLLVLFRHSNLEYHFLQKFGWLGVDLFFVLSGFLISNLLFVEYKQSHRIEVWRFLARRTFKVFPPFYFFILSSLLITIFTNGLADVDLKKLISEVFYLQSYLPRIWEHTWSLAVEEHFYLIFSVLIFLLIRGGYLEKKSLMISSMILLLITSLCLRLQISWIHRDEEFFGFVQTHLRSDGIILGVLTSYLLNFINFPDSIKRRRSLLFLLSILVISPAFFFPGGSFFMNTAGLTLANVGFAIIAMQSLEIDELIQKRVPSLIKYGLKLLEFIGLSSYSIYLWHLSSKKITANVLPDGINPNISTLMYVGVSILLGIFMFYLIEKPSMLLRDRLFPQKASSQQKSN